MIIASTDEAEHDSTLRTVMLKARDENIKYYKDIVERNRDKIHAGPCMTSSDQKTKSYCAMLMNPNKANERSLQRNYMWNICILII